MLKFISTCITAALFAALCALLPLSIHFPLLFLLTIPLAFSFGAVMFSIAFDTDGVK